MSQPNDVEQPAIQQAAQGPVEVKIAAIDGALKKSVKSSPPIDAYNLNFKQLRTKYMDDTTQKVKFVKPSFVHYCKNPYTYAQKFGGDDTILTMELIKAPQGLNYKNLEDPKVVREAKKKKDAEQEAEQEAEREAQLEAQQEAEQNAEPEYDQEYGQENNSYNEYGGEEQDYGEENAEDDEDDEDDYAGGGEDRAYEGNMFGDKKKLPIKYILTDRTLNGQKNEKTQSTDYVLISTWRIGMGQIRFSRIADVAIPYFPIETDKRFYCSHSGDALYFLTMKDGKQCIVTVYLADFSWRISDFSSEEIPEMKDLKDSAMICKNHVLVINVPEGLTPRKSGMLSGDFVAFNLQTLDRIWTATNAEKVFFNGFNSMIAGNEKAMLEKQGKAEEDDTDGRCLQEQEGVKKQLLEPMSEYDQEDMPEKIVVLKLSVEEVKITKTAAEKAAENEKKEGEKAAEAKTEAKLFYRFYSIDNFETQNFAEDGELKWEHSEPTLLPVPVPEKEEPEKAGLGNMILGAIKKLIPVKLQPEEPEIVDPSAVPRREEASKPQVIYGNDCDFTEMVLIFVGEKGAQHHIHQLAWDQDQEVPKKSQQKPGLATIRKNENTFLRTMDEFFTILIYQNGDCEAKMIGSLIEKSDKMPVIEMENVEKASAVDAWVTFRLTDLKNSVIQTLTKSSTSEYLCCASMRIGRLLAAGDGIIDPKLLKTMKTNYTKLKNQEIQMQYPVIASNIGTRRITVQSIVQPGIHGQFRLQDADFIAFVDYNALAEIGYVDARSKMEKIRMPLNETGEFIAFLTRVHGACEEGDDCKKGDLILNLLSVDSYSEPMTFTLYTTNYEACMQEGCRDDVIHKAYAIECKSARSTDVTLVIQYNDSIVFDCVTSTKQKPIMFPRPHIVIPKELKNETEKKDGQEPAETYTKKQIDKRNAEIEKKKEEDEEFEDIKASKDCSIVPVPMIMDEKGFIYLLTTNAEKQVKVYRVNTEKEMGEESFFQLVYHFQANWVYFFQKSDDKFYMMDDSKKVRVLVQDPKTHNLSIQTTLELCVFDKEQLVQSPFSEYAVSNGVIHAGNVAMFMLNTKSQDNPTWARFDVAIKGYECIAGPKTANGMGHIYYIEESLNDAGTFGQYCLVTMPKADHSFMTCLPIAKENQNNFCSFIGPEKLMTQYGGKLIVFNTKGDFDGAVKFVCADYIQYRRLRMVSFCESKQYFVFAGPEFLPKKEEEPKSQLVQAAKNNLKSANTGEKAPPAKGPKIVYYIFFLEYIEKAFGDGRKSYYQLTHKAMPIEPVMEPKLKSQTTFIMNPNGTFDQTTITTVDKSTKGVIIYDVVLLSASTSDIQIATKTGISAPGAKTAQVAPEVAAKPTAISEVKFRFEFTSDNLTTQQARLEATLKPLIKAQQKATEAQEDYKDQAELQRMLERRSNMHKAWKIGNYMIAKCGSEVKYAKVSDPSQVFEFEFCLGPQVWLQNVFLTGIDGIVQFYAINDEEHLVYAISWNMELNREQTMFQTSYKVGQMPENLILSSFSSCKGARQFNFCLEDGCIVNLENNLPIQFFDAETEGDLVPHGPLKFTVQGQKKISEDQLKYLDLLNPGRVQHFISLTDLLYWERFQNDKNNHELSRGKVTTFSPVSRFPNGISIFHYFATNEKVLETFREACELAMSEQQLDKRITLMPLAFLHKFPTPNKAGHRVTPIQVAMEKQSPVCFEIMMSMLTEQQGVCITQHLLGKLPDLIGMGSPAVNELFNNSFRSTDQLSGPRPLNWPGADEELFINVATAYLTDETLQQLVYDKMGGEPAEDAQGEAEPDVYDPNAKPQATYLNGFMQYNMLAVEELVQFDEAESTMKQVEAKLLDFDWIFTGENSACMIKVLAETENDEIFSQSQIRVLIEFMWQEYYDAIYSTLFIPYVLYFVAFSLYATQFAAIEEQDKQKIGLMDFNFIMKWICLVVWGKNFITFFLLECIQFKQDPWSYFTNFWNILDFLSLISCAVYIGFEISGSQLLENPTASFNVAILGSVSVLMLWMKLFYWLRLFKPFSAFIRIISEIGKDIKIFAAMLLLCLAAFANCLMVLNDNRIANEQNPIYDDLVGFGPANALIHAYLTGMGDFNKDFYSDGNAVVVWIFFLMATVLVQLVFMNMLIAIMGESFGRITAITEQAVMKELCVMMNDNIWLLKFGELFSHSRYILWLSPGANKTPGTAVERQLQQLRSYVEERAEKTDTNISRQMGNMDEKMEAITSMLETLINPKAPEADEEDIGENMWDNYGNEDDEDEE